MGMHMGQTTDSSPGLPRSLSVRAGFFAANDTLNTFTPALFTNMVNRQRESA